MTLELGMLRRPTTVVVVLVAVALAGGTLGASLAPAAKSAKPPCTKRALEAGLRRSKMGGRVDPKAWGCAGRFAYAGVTVHEIEATVLFLARGRNWKVASRLKYCKKYTVPARIYRQACETS
jgi:hypothetical protein